MNLASLLFDVARRQPDYPAVTDLGQSRSYQQLMLRAAHIAGSFQDLGLSEGNRVLLFMENCGEFLECLIASWTAGLCAVPVNAKLHPREVAYIASDSGARLVITTPGLASTIDFLEESIETLDMIACSGTDEYERLLSGPPITPVETAAADRAWLFYTSGTTGKPKGAILSHRNLLFMSLAYYADIDSLGPDDTKLHTAPLSHASGLFALPHLLKGGHQVVLPGFDIDEIADALTRYTNVTMFAAPTMLTRLVNSPVIDSLEIQNLKTIYYGGGPMYVADLERALTIFGPRLYQIYGQGESPMTITGVSKSMYADTENPRFREWLSSCGYARTGVEVKVVDDHDHELPSGEVGEVIAYGDCVMEAYWNNPKANAETLRGGWLHTGDLGSIDEQGLLTLRDRSKDLIISGGTNIYPREIEEVLLRHPGIVEASVVGREHPEWGEEVVAFVVAKSDEQVTQADLDALCLGHIARFKRPKIYHFVEELPKNNYGKILKTELRKRLQEESRV